jgi:feruloyl esterase
MKAMPPLPACGSRIISAPAALLLIALAGTPVHGADPAPEPLYPDAAPIRSCESLIEVSLPNTTIDSAVINPNDGSCRVTATVTHPPAGDRVRIFIGLPVKGWNGRFRGMGGGGFSGGSPNSLQGPVAQGFAAGATDTGHPGGSGSFALDEHGRLNWQLIRDNAYLGIHEMTVVGKALVKAFYGTSARYSYFTGGSTGGRQGLMEAQRYPDDYDGIVSACPAINWHRFLPADLWPQVAMLAEGNFVPKSKLDAVTAAAVAACDPHDGVTDGVIDDPYGCDYDPLAFVGSDVGGTPFTEMDAAVVRRIWEGPRGQGGEFLWYGLSRGTDLSALAATGGAPLAGKPFIIPLEWFQYFLVQDPNWDWATLTPAGFELRWIQSVEQYGAVIGTDKVDLRPFRDRGGKIIIYHGLSDQLIPAEGSIQYYQRLQQEMGGPERTAEFARLFLAPGVDHGFRGPGPTPVGLAELILRWVEQGKAPERLLAEKRAESGEVIRSRPIFPYPNVARYTGTGSTDASASFESFNPGSE